MNDCLSLPLRQGSGGGRALTGWECLWMPLGEGEAEGLPAGRGSGWAPVEVPRQLSASEGRSSIWYRTAFARPDHSGRVLLRVGGAFLAANCWLNGRLLGSHYGYFAPFGFDLTPYLKAENLLVICCESPIETDLARKRHVMGFFNDGDTRPYPASAFFSLPEPYRWEVPIGLWQAVELEYLGAVSLDWVRLKPRLEAGDVGRLEVEARLRNLDGREMAGEVVVEIAAPEGTRLKLRREFSLPGGVERTVSMTISIPGARRWSPWRFGEPVLYSALASVLVGGRESARSADTFGFRELEHGPAHEGWSLSVNGQPIFLRGADYMPGMHLDTLDDARFDADLALARDANLDALRVHAHVLPEGFYRRADAAGMLVLADFPLTLSYAYHAEGEDARFFETAVREQVPEMVEMLRNRASVVAWIAHDDPPWIAANAELADVHAVRQNYTIDQEARDLFDSLDGSRPALAASGEVDAHLYAGWKHGSWTDFAEARSSLVTELGAQAPPTPGSADWDAIGARWPVADDEPAWIHAGFQPTAWAERGAGLPSAHDTLEDFVAAGQSYQAWIVRYAVEQLRKRKFEPCWGAFVYHLVDPFPGFGYGVLDSARVGKAAFAALREAMAATRVLLDPVGFSPLHPQGIAYRLGDPVAMRLLVVNDNPDLRGSAQLRWAVWRESAPERTRFDRLRDSVRRKSYSGTVDFALPTVSEPALQLASLNLALEAEGGYRLEAELLAAGRLVDAAALDFSVSPDPVPERRRPALPRYLAERLLAQDSLRSEPDGMAVTLLNQTRPAVLTAFGGLKLDGVALEGVRVLMQAPSGLVPLPRRVELPVGREVPIHLETGHRLEPGEHRLEVDITVPGVGSGRVVVIGSVGEEGLPRPGG